MTHGKNALSLQKRKVCVYSFISGSGKPVSLTVHYWCGTANLLLKSRV